MKKLFLISFIILSFAIYLNAQPVQTLVATISAGVATLQVSESTLTNAFEDELNDSTSFNNIDILYYNPDSTWYIIATGSKGGNTVVVSWDLKVVSSTNLFVNTNQTSTQFKKCRWECCNDCGIFPWECGPCNDALIDCKIPTNCVGTTLDKQTTDGHIGSFY